MIERLYRPRRPRIWHRVDHERWYEIEKAVRPFLGRGGFSMSHTGEIMLMMLDELDIDPLSVSADFVIAVVKTESAEDHRKRSLYLQSLPREPASRYPL